MRGTSPETKTQNKQNGGRERDAYDKDPQKKHTKQSQRKHLLTHPRHTPPYAPFHSTLSSICKQVRLTSGSKQDAAHPSCDSPNTSRFASRLVLAMSAWSVKTRRAPSRHCRDARVYGHTTTAMHDMRVHPPPLPSEVTTSEIKSIHSTMSSICKTVRLTSGSS